MIRMGISFVLVLAVPALGQVVSYEAKSFPEQNGWKRIERSYWPDRWLDSGWFVLNPKIWHPDPPRQGEDDFYRRELDEFAGSESLFVQWRVETTGIREEIDAVAPASIVASGQRGVRYHFTISRDLVRFIRGAEYPLVWVEIEPGVPHTYRVEIRGEEHYAFWIDGVLIDEGEPTQRPYPTEDSFMIWGARAAWVESVTRWDYVRYGVIPEDGSGNYDSDEDVDEDDYYFFHECLAASGPDTDAGPGCRFADFDFDTDVDLDDFVMFQSLLTDPD